MFSCRGKPKVNRAFRHLSSIEPLREGQRSDRTENSSLPTSRTVSGCPSPRLRDLTIIYFIMRIG
jgi:hypothetical protein